MPCLLEYTVQETDTLLSPLDRTRTTLTLQLKYGYLLHTGHTGHTAWPLVSFRYETHDTTDTDKRGPAHFSSLPFRQQTHIA